MRIVFAGTPQFAADHLQHLIKALPAEAEQSSIVAVYTQPDRRAGRGKRLMPSPVKQLALNNNIPVLQPESLRHEDAQGVLRALEADLMIVAAYGLLLPEEVLEIPRYGCINIHASLLPRWRGAAPIERAILAGDKETGITIMQMDKGLDTGDMLLKASCRIDANETGDSLREKLSELGKPLIIETIRHLHRNTLEAEQQDERLSSYAAKLEKVEGQLNWEESAVDTARKIRALTSALACFATYNAERIKITEASESDYSLDQGEIEGTQAGEIVHIEKNALHVRCGYDSSLSVLSITRLQLPGKKDLSVADILNGKSGLFVVGELFS